MPEFKLKIFQSFLILFITLAGSVAGAQDWVMLQATESVKSAELKTLLFLQPSFSYTKGSLLSAGPFKGKKGIFNLNGPDFRSSTEFHNARGLVLIRGFVPKTNKKINFFGMIDFGKNLLTGSEKTTKNPRNLQLADISLTFNYLPFFRIRAGQFIVPGSNEMMKAVHSYDYINFTNFTVFTMLDWNMPDAGDGTGSNRPRFPNAGFRDIGVMAFDTFSFYKSKHTYAFMLGQGNGINRFSNDKNLDFHGRYRFYFPFSKEKNLEFILWGVKGKRELYSKDSVQVFRRDRFGIDLSANWKNWRTELSGAYADGIIFHGTFGAGPPGLKNNKNQVASFLTLPSENAFGGHFSVNYDISSYVVGFRYDFLNYGMRKNINGRAFRTFTLSAQHKFGTSPTRLILNYEWRKAEAPRLSDTHPVNQFLSDMDNRITLSLFWFI